MTNQNGIRQRELCDRLGLDYKTPLILNSPRCRRWLDLLGLFGLKIILVFAIALPFVGGLNLAIAKAIAQTHRGSIQVESTLILILPLKGNSKNLC